MNFTEVNLQQGTDEWLRWRKEGIGASEVPIIMGTSPWSTIAKLYSDKLELNPKPFTDNFAMQRGRENEPVARDLFEYEVGRKYPAITIESVTHPFMKASLDGYNKETHTILEIKVPGRADHKLAIQGQIPDKYYPQLQHQLLVAGSDLAYYVSLDMSKFDGGIIVVEVKADKIYQRRLLRRAKYFWHHVVNKKELPMRRVKLCEHILQTSQETISLD